MTCALRKLKIALDLGSWRASDACPLLQAKVDEVPKLKETVQNLQARCHMLERNLDKVLLDLQYWRDGQVLKDVDNLKKTVVALKKKAEEETAHAQDEAAGRSTLERHLSQMAKELSENRAQLLDYSSAVNTRTHELSMANQALHAQGQRPGKPFSDVPSCGANGTDSPGLQGMQYDRRDSDDEYFVW